MSAPGAAAPTAADLPFGLLDDLPQGRLAIQASAGTGKTFTLAALATRFIAERDVAASELLVVTFTRAATTELRARVRDRLVQAAEYLLARRSSEPALGDDELLVHLAATDRELRLARLERAVTEFDAATITTIHGFATQVLGTLGTTAGTDPDATLVDDSAQLAAECCADVLAAASGVHPVELLPNFERLVRTTRNAINIADLELTPGPDQEGATEAELLLVELVQRSIAMMRERRRQAGTLSFDDILVELRRALASSGRLAAIETLRTRFRVALIDEFQDTDPVQWDIFRTLFGDARADTSLVLVGDPKQAIYSFRGANVHTYLDAVADGDETQRRSLGTNWRSDAAVLDATRLLLEGTTYGDDEIRFQAVQPAPVNEARRLRTAQGVPLPALSLRLALDPKLTRSTRKPQDIYVEQAEGAIYGDLVVRVRELLDSAHVPDDGPAGQRPVRPSDIAVLVRSAKEAEAIQRQLVDQGVPAVLARGDSVIESPAAEQWRWLLEGLRRPSDPGRARTFALSWFGGRDADWIHRASDEELGGVQEQLHDWAETLAERGPVELVRRIWSESGVTGRVLARPDGDRAMTDLDHVAELLQSSSAGQGPTSVAGLLAVLDAPEPIEVDADVDRDLASRRVESEAEAVQIMTIWVSKGLEFSIVCCPTLWRRRDGETIYQDPDTGDRTYDVTRDGKWPDKATSVARRQLATSEAAGEALRLLYVALTRAKHQTIVWWSRCPGSATSPLARVLFARTEGVIDPEKYLAQKVELPDDADALDVVAPLAAGSDGTIVVAVHGRPPAPTARWVDPATGTEHPQLELARWDRTPDRSPHRWSFTAITNRARIDHVDPYDASGADAGAADEQGPDAGDVADLPTLPAADPPVGPGATPAPDLQSGLAMLPAGAAFGTLVHSVLEEVDFTDQDLDSSLRTQIEEQLAWRALDLRPVGVDGATTEDGADRLVAGLRAAIETPLGPLLGGVALRDISRADRLNEMSFELRLGRDGAGGRRANDRQIGRLVQRHLTPSDLFHSEPLYDWAGQLASGLFSAELAGHLTGSIDVVLRVHDQAGTPRFFVVDYKTNRLSEPGRPPGADDYRHDHLVDAMAHHHYPLQALLYAVALHRYLRWRLPGYDPAIHLGGAAYLFLRGMTGASVPTTDGQPHGVFTWQIPPALVVELSDLLDGTRITGLGS